MSKPQRNGSNETREYVLTWDKVKALLAEPAYAAAIERAAAHTKRPVVSPEDAVRSIVALVVDNPYLGGCHPLSFVFAAVQSIRTGLPLGKPLDLAYGIPRYNRAVAGLWCYFSPSYMGLIAVARRSGEIPHISASVVREGDEFYWQEGTDPKIEHKPLKEERGEKITHAYGVARLTGSPLPQIVVLDRAEIDKRRAVADALKRKPDDRNNWDKWEREMSQKSAIVALAHYLPRSPEFGFALYAETQLASDHADELDSNIIGELEMMLDRKLLSATTAQAVDVEERIAARAAALVEAKRNGTAPPSRGATAPLPTIAADDAPLEPATATERLFEDGPPERTTISTEEARALVALASTVYPTTQLETWIEETLARYGVASLEDLAPSEERAATEALQHSAAAD